MIDKLIQLLKNFFGITYKEGRGMVILFALLFVAVLAPGLIRQLYQPHPGIPIEFIPLSKLPDKVDSIASSDPVLFSFNPNSVSYDSLLLLGLESRIAARLVSYRNNGGRFFAEKDLLKIYDLPEEWYLSIKDSVILPPQFAEKITAKPVQTVEQANMPVVTESSIEEDITPQDLNT